MICLEVLPRSSVLLTSDPSSCKCEDITRGGVTQLQFEVHILYASSCCPIALTRTQACLADMPFAKHMRDSVLQLHASGADCRIISDANTFFISSFLKSQGISHCFTQVVSNPATWAGGVLRVAPHTAWGHAEPCGFPCPENMCKASASTALHTSLAAH